MTEQRSIRKRSAGRETQLRALLLSGVSEEILLEAEGRLGPECPDLAERLWRDQRLSADEITGALSAMGDHPVAQVPIKIDQGALSILPLESWSAHRLLPIARAGDGKIVVIATLNPFDEEITRLIEQRSQRSVRFQVAPPEALITALGTLKRVESRGSRASSERNAVPSEGQARGRSFDPIPPADTLSHFQSFLARIPRPKT